MSIRDFFTQDLYHFYNPDNIDPLWIIFNLICVFLLGLVILFTYKRSYQTTVYNRSFAVGLPVAAMVTSIVIVSVSTNIILALGMVGALSIIRFRTALKNPFDTVFMFWAIGLGITAGAGLLLISVISTFAIAIVIYILIRIEIFVSSYFVIIRADDAGKEEKILNKIKSIYGKYTMRNKTVKRAQLDLTLEVRSKADKSESVNKIQDIDGVKSVILLSHQGDYIAD